MRRTQAGFVTLAALLIILIITTTAAILLTSLFGEIQGESGYNQATSALGVGEAGLHWAGNKLASAGTATYGGDTNQSVLGANGTSVGMFDVRVTCMDGSSAATGCSSQPNNRLVASTGYVPSKTVVLGKRTVQAQVNLNNTTAVICAYQSVIFNSNAAVSGNVGSEGSIQLDAGATISPGGGEPGNATAVTTISCASTCTSQIAGAINPGQPAGTVCPDRAVIASAFACTAQTSDPSLSGTSLTISSSGPYNSIALNGGTLTFVVPSGQTLTVQTVTFHATSGSIIQVQGGGSVQFIASSQQAVDGNSTIGKDVSTGGLVNPNRLLIENCNAASGTEAIHVNAGTTISAVMIAPFGYVHLDAGTNSQGAVLGNSVKLDAGNVFSYNPFAVLSAYPHLVSWQDVP